MAYTLGNSGIGQGTGAASTATTGAVNTTGATLIVIYTCSFAGTLATPTDSKSNTWTAATAQHSFTSGYTTYDRWWYCLAPTTDAAHTFSMGTLTDPGIAVIALTGNDVATPIDTDTSNGGGSVSTLQTGSVTPANAGGLALAGFVSAFQEPTSINSSFVIKQTATHGTGLVGIGLAALNPSGGSALNPTWTLSGSATSALASILTLKEAGAGGGFFGSSLMALQAGRGNL